MILLNGIRGATSNFDCLASNSFNFIGSFFWGHPTEVECHHADIQVQGRKTPSPALMQKHHALAIGLLDSRPS